MDGRVGGGGDPDHADDPGVLLLGAAWSRTSWPRSLGLAIPFAFLYCVLLGAPYRMAAVHTAAEDERSRGS